MGLVSGKKRERFGGRCFSEFGTIHRTRAVYMPNEGMREDTRGYLPRRMLQTCPSHFGFVPAGVLLQRLPDKWKIGHRRFVVRILFLEATGDVAVTRTVSGLFPTCYLEASRLGVPLDCLAFMSHKNRLQSACCDSRTLLCLTGMFHFKTYVW